MQINGLSPLAIQNLITFYKKDYDCSKQLENMEVFR